jgi:hypothetical protein
MPRKSENDRHQVYARLRVGPPFQAGMSSVDAYRQAGYRGKDPQKRATEIEHARGVQDLMEQLKLEKRKLEVELSHDMHVTRNSIIRNLLEDAAQARQLGRVSAAIRAHRIIAELAGHLRQEAPVVMPTRVIIDMRSDGDTSREHVKETAENELVYN